MSLRHDPLLARALAREIGRRRGGRRVVSLHLAREPRVAELRFDDARSLLFLLHPEEGALLAAEPILPGEGTTFRKLFLGAAWTPPDERILLLSLEDGGGRERGRIAVELHTNQWNLLLLDVLPGEAGRSRAGGEEGAALRVRAALWPRRTAHRTLEAGAPYELPPGGRVWAEETPSGEAWRELLAPVPPGNRRRTALREVAWLSSVNVDHVLGAAAEAEGEELLREAHERYLALRAAVGVEGAAVGPPGGDEPAAGPGDEPAAGPGGGQTHGGPPAGGAAWLLERPWGAQPYPASLHEPAAQPFPSLLDAMEAAIGGGEARERRVRELATTAVAPARGRRPPASGARRDEALRLRRALLARRKRLRRRKAALERELERGPAPEELRAVGNLILARLRQVPRGAERITLEDFDGSEREVELDPKLPPAESAAAYFDEASRRERARERLPAEVAAAERRLGALEEALQTVERALEAEKEGAPGDGPGVPESEPGAPRLDEERVESLWELAGGRPDAGGAPREEGERVPYLRYRSSGGLEIRVGRSARGNDELTFHHSSPEDIWLHARQVQGAHVILRWGRKEENPARQDLLEAAVAAAVHSGARHSGTVAVDWTRRKYVRKPRKAPPGAVLPERVQTVFVEPDAKLVEGMKEES